MNKGGVSKIDTPNYDETMLCRPTHILDTSFYCNCDLNTTILCRISD